MNRSTRSLASRQLSHAGKSAIEPRFAAEGARVTILDLDADGGRRVAEEIGLAATHVSGNVAVPAGIDRAMDAAVAHGSRLDVLVNNAGRTHCNKPLAEVTEEEFDRVFAVNVASIFHAIQASLPIFERQDGGVMLNIGSTAGLRPRLKLVLRVPRGSEPAHPLACGRIRAEAHPGHRHRARWA